jgi:hypothetical protein
MSKRIGLGIGAAVVAAVAVLALSHREAPLLLDKRSGGASLPTSAPGPSGRKEPDVEAYLQPSHSVDPMLPALP